MWEAGSIVKENEGICVIQGKDQPNGGIWIEFSQNKGGFSPQGTTASKTYRVPQ
jgi:hypothetical protein